MLQLTKFAYFLIFIVTTWLLGLAWFIFEIPDEMEIANIETDAVVVLTGGSLRIEKGLDIFANTASKKILISGVGHGVTKQDILNQLDDKLVRNAIDPEDIILGTMADNTKENVDETKIFMELHGFKSLRLVTSNYHMQRSALMFERMLPNYRIIEHPVCSDNFKKKGTYISYKSFKLAFSEYNKFLWMLAEIKLTEAKSLYDNLVRWLAA